MLIRSKKIQDLGTNLKTLRGQLGDAWGGLVFTDSVLGIAGINLHPRASKYATTAIEYTGFEILPSGPPQ